jgi:hypothetical protein
VRQFRVSGSEQAIDQVTKATIQGRYSLEDEIKVLRKAVVALSRGEPLPSEFVEYNDFVEQVLGENKELKLRTRGK